MPAIPQPASSPGRLADDEELVRRIGERDPAAFETLMRRYNGRLFRVARAILKDDAAAEDALQDGYLAAFQHIGEFRGGSALSTWLTRIVVNQALMRLRSARRDNRESTVVPFASGANPSHREIEVADDTTESPLSSTLRGEMRRILERRIDELPVAFRTVFVMREVEDMTVDETADALAIPPATVRTRLFRARALLRDALARDLDVAAADVFSFDGERCDRIVSRVLARIEMSPTRSEPS